MLRAIYMRNYLLKNGEKVLDLSHDIKLQMFFNNIPLLEEACAKSRDKGITPAMRSRFFSPDGREEFLESLIG